MCQEQHQKLRIGSNKQVTAAHTIMHEYTGKASEGGAGWQLASTDVAERQRSPRRSKERERGRAAAPPSPPVCVCDSVCGMWAASEKRWKKGVL